MITIIAFIVTIGIIVTIHEYGHFQVARWCGVKVLKFSIGFGKPLFSKTFGKDKTEFVLAAIPLGGFVKMLDENELKAEADQQLAAGQGELYAPIVQNYTEADLSRAFNRQSVYKRIAIVLAGPVANLLLAILVYWVLIMQGTIGLRPVIGQVTIASSAAQAQFVSGEVIEKIDGKSIKTWSEARWAFLEALIENKVVTIEVVNTNNELSTHKLNLATLDKNTEIDVLEKIGIKAFMPTMPAVIDQVLPDGPAKKSGLMHGDKVISIDALQVNSWQDAVHIIKTNPDKTLQFIIQRKTQIVNLAVTPKGVKEGNQLVGKIGASAKIDQKKLDELLVKQNFSVMASLKIASIKTWKTSLFSLKMLWNMVIGEVSWKSISGPVTIASYAGESAGMGLKAFLSFLALISISIGVLNLLPIPVLDGGHLMYYIAEIIKGSPVSENVMMTGQKIGFGLLSLLMIVAFLNDINRLMVG